MRNIIFIICCLVSFPIWAQSVEDNPDVRNWLDNMFQRLDKSKVPHGLLRDYAFELADLDIYNGKELNDSNYVNRVGYENLLRTIRSASIGTKPFNAEEVLAAQYALTGKGKGAIGVVLYQYSYIRADALSNNLIKYENEQISDNVINGVWQNPYATGYTLGFSAQDTTLYGSTITYSFPATIWKSNITASSVEFDAGDGRGYVLISKGGSRSVAYNGGGVKHLKMRVKLSNGSYLYCHSLVKVISDSEISTRAIVDGEIEPDETKEIEVTLPYNGVVAKGRISYLFAANTEHIIKKPFIVMEGFDPIELVKKEEAYRGDVKYGSTNLKTFVTYLEKRFSAYHKLTSEYDIIYIDLYDCKCSIQANARLFESAIEIINKRKSDEGCTEKNIVFAQSMGGLIARYGLKEMENLGKVHDTSLLFFQDTPHLGAHIPLGILQGMNGLLRFYYDNKIFGRLDFGDVKSKLAPILYSDAAKQMLINFVNDNGDVDNSVHNAWQRELSQMGYPQGDNGYKMRIVSLCNGQTPVISNFTSYISVDGNVSTSFLGEFLLKAFTPFMLLPGLVFDDWQIFVLGLLPGSSTLAAHFEANSPAATKPSCYMYLRYIKKVLWLAKIQKTVYSYTKYYPSNMIEYDYMPGSFYAVPGLESKPKTRGDFDKFLGRYNLTTSFTNTIMFIPTVSSLDIGEGKIELTTLDYKKKYLMDFPPQAPKHTPFDAFYITNGSTDHTSFEPIMLDWIIEQMKVTIDGPDIATNGCKYAIRNNTQNYAINWSSSDESVATIDNTGTLTMKKHGVITITANCVVNNITTKFHKEVMVGFPPFVLEWSINGQYFVTARCIEPAAEPFLKYIQYEWLGKSDSSLGKNWAQSTKNELSITPDKLKSYKLTVYMRPTNAEGIKGEVLFISLDATAPYVFDPKDIYYINSYREPSSFEFGIYPNPLYADQELLKNDERFQIVSVHAKATISPDYVDIYFDTPLPYRTVLLKDLCGANYFENWFRSCSRGGYTEFILNVFFKNKDDKFVAYKLTRCIYTKY